MHIVDTTTLTQTLRVSRHTIHRLEKRGVIAPIRIGRAVRWDLQATLQRLSANTNSQTPAAQLAA